MTPKIKASWSYLAWAFALALGASGMYAANQKQISDAHRDASLASAEYQLAAKALDEAELKASEVREFVDGLDYPVAMLDQQGKVTEWNAAAERAFGWTKADLQVNGIESIIPDEMRERHHAAFGKAMQGSGKIVGRVTSPVQRVKCVVIHKDPNRKPIPVEVSVRVVREADGDMYAMANIDRQKNIVSVDADAEAKP